MIDKKTKFTWVLDADNLEATLTFPFELYLTLTEEDVNIIDDTMARLREVAKEFFGSCLIPPHGDNGITVYINSANTPSCLLNNPKLLARCFAEFCTKQTTLKFGCKVKKVA